jgi:hypothetical protein
MNSLPWRGVGAASQNRDEVALLLKVARQHLAHLAAAAGKHNAQRARDHH